MKKISTVLIGFLIFGSIFTNVVNADDGTELFGDPLFSNGVAIGYANTYWNYNQDCIGRWKSKMPFYGQAKWMFTEISERFYFCDNVDNNPSFGQNFVNYISPNAGMKKISIDRNGTAHMEFDTSWEWRGGCNLCKPWIGVDSNPPKYGDTHANWPTFLVSQMFSPSYIPSRYPADLRSIPEAERMYLTKYNKVQFTGQFRLNKVDKIGNSQCPTGDWTPQVTSNGVMTFNPCTQTCGPNTQACFDVPNHAVFYVAFVLWHNVWKTPQDNSVPNVIYQLLPLVYSEDGVANVGGLTSYIMGDQYGDRTYFAKLGDGVTAKAKKLTEGSQTFENVEINVGDFSRNILHEINPSIDPGEYFVSAFLTGWEIWGGYETDVEMRSLSLKGYGGPTPTPTLTPVPTPIPKPGDLDGDGDVDSADFNKMVANFGHPYNIFDYNVLVENFGK